MDVVMSVCDMITVLNHGQKLAEGNPSQIQSNPLVIEASKKVIAACEKYGKSCGTQVADSTEESINALFDLGHTYAILGSDLFVLWKWAEKMNTIIKKMKS